MRKFIIFFIVIFALSIIGVTTSYAEDGIRVDNYYDIPVGPYQKLTKEFHCNYDEYYDGGPVGDSSGKVLHDEVPEQFTHDPLNLMGDNWYRHNSLRVFVINESGTVGTFDAEIKCKKINRDTIPRQIQLGVPESQLSCWKNRVLLQSIHQGKYACVNPSSVDKILERGWASQIKKFPENAEDTFEKDEIQILKRNFTDQRFDQTEESMIQYENEFFEFLTKNKWRSCIGEGSMFGATCTTLEYYRNGDFEWGTMSDYFVGGKDKWNFKLITKDSGLIFKEKVSGQQIKRDGENILVGRSVYEPFEVIKYTPEDLALQRMDLPRVSLPDIFYKLLDGIWENTNGFNRGFIPQSLTFSDNATVLMSFRDGECFEIGHWGSTENSMSIIYSATCDTRGAPEGFVSRLGTINPQSNLLEFFSSSYYNTKNTIDEKIFIFDRYTKSIKTTGNFSGEIQKDKPTTFDFTFENVSGIEKELGKLSITISSCGPTKPNVGCPGTKKNYETSKDFSGILLKPGEIHHDSVTIVPSTSGKSYLNFVLEFEDERQPYRASHGYILDVESN